MNYLIPANSKRSMLILGLFTPFDLILFGSGLAITILLLLIVQPNNLLKAIIDLLPGVTTGFLVIPIANYHNVRVFIMEVYRFYTSREKFIWKGWCVKDEFGEK